MKGKKAMSNVKALYPQEASTNPTGCLRARVMLEYQSLSGNSRMRRLTVDTLWGVDIEEAKAKMAQFRNANEGCGFSYIDGTLTINL
jgi:hypothetical protein